MQLPIVKPFCCVPLMMGAKLRKTVMDNHWELVPLVGAVRAPLIGVGAVGS